MIATGVWLYGLRAEVSPWPVAQRAWNKTAVLPVVGMTPVVSFSVNASLVCAIQFSEHAFRLSLLSDGFPTLSRELYRKAADRVSWEADPALAFDA